MTTRLLIPILAVTCLSFAVPEPVESSPATGKTARALKKRTSGRYKGTARQVDGSTITKLKGTIVLPRGRGRTRGKLRGGGTTLRFVGQISQFFRRSEDLIRDGQISFLEGQGVVAKSTKFRSLARFSGRRGERVTIFIEYGGISLTFRGSK